MLADLSHNSRGVNGITVQKVVMRNSRFFHQLLHQHLTETSGMRDRQTNVLIKMEDLDLSPIDVPGASERIQEFELRCSGGRDDASLALLCDSAPNCRRGLLGGSAAQRGFVAEHFEQHGRIQSEMGIGNELYKPMPLDDAAVKKFHSVKTNCPRRGKKSGDLLYE